ncbi:MULTISPECIES: 3-oxoacyl-ACP synthase III family protein [Paenibacillus]|uniref:3-oxoacyl-ACP synthase III family protein n=1 Tax=Paenibacillus TaxID=44249 RepID=UPI0011A773E3
MYSSYIKAIEFFVPHNKVLNDPESKLTSKVGIYSRHIAREDELASDLACEAAKKLFDSKVCKPEDIDFLLYCTQSPDHYLPTTACLIQHRIGLRTSCGALDINLGCSGYVYSLSLAKGLIETGTVKNVLLITSDTYSKYINPKDYSVTEIFGDGAAATLITRCERSQSSIGPFEFGTDGSGAENLIVHAGGMRERITNESIVEQPDEKGNIRSRANLYMNGYKIFKFASKEVTSSVRKFLEQNNESIADYDYFVFHQANEHMMKALRDKLEIPEDKFLMIH